MKTFGEFLSEDVDYGSASKALRTEIDGAIAFAKSKGYRIPTVKVFNRAGANWGGMYSASNDTIFIGSRLPNLLQGTAGFKSTTHRYHTYLHETGHMMHSDAIGDAYDNMKNSHYFPGLDVGAEVSRYAKVNPLEFVAEVFAGLATGKTFSELVMRQYSVFRGPKA